MLEMLQPLGGNSILCRPFKSSDYELYTSTLSKYRDLFSEEPPESVWEDSGNRFDKGTFLQVNLYRQVVVQWKALNDSEYLEDKTSGRWGDKGKQKLRRELWKDPPYNWRSLYSYVPAAGAKVEASEADVVSDDEGVGKFKPWESVNIGRKSLNSEDMSIWSIFSEDPEDAVDCEDKIL